MPRSEERGSGIKNEIWNKVINKAGEGTTGVIGFVVEEGEDGKKRYQGSDQGTPQGGEMTPPTQ